MTDRFATSPFGGRAMTRAQFIINEQVRKARQALMARRGEDETSAPDDSAEGVDKWRLIRALSEGRAHFALSDRTIAVLDALTSFHPERMLDPAGPLVVFPSNAELSIRARGMAPATLRRHLAALVSAGLVLRRDSANGKRYARRDDTGSIEQAFGFDLAPLALRAAEIEEAAAAQRQLSAAIRTVRGEITIHLRDIAKTLEAAEAERRPIDWTGLRDRLEALSGRLARNLDLPTLSRRLDGLAKLRDEVESAYLSSLGDRELDHKEQEMSANDSRNERHIQNSNTDSHSESFQEKERSGWPTALETKSAVQTGRPSAERAKARHEAVGVTSSGPRQGPAVPLETVLQRCPQMRDYAPGGLAGWPDMMRAADTVRSMLGISPDAWRKARDEMGEANAAIAIAAMLERAEAIRSPGGYLRTLTERASAGKFSVKPMLAALASAKHA
ncbi:plasmid replication protein RepC [Pararhizobium haloflavum]|uniref:plasmid replication protein RepC n=1 Tax=Pararhizobium haloflavum TaxID=2037914 RepID=UPI000C1969BF|nr:plasmid replication protein RepC [Pararhizobium haloflavum]